MSHPEYVSRVAKFFSDIGGRGLLMHGTEGEVYANPQRCPQISLIDSSGVRVLQERQSEMPDEPVPLPVAKDPETTARWIERCLAGSEPVPASLKIQMACCWSQPANLPRWLKALLASGKASNFLVPPTGHLPGLSVHPLHQREISARLLIS